MDITHAQRPPAWMVFGLPWPEEAEDMAEAAYALAPVTVPRSLVPPGLAAILDYAETYADRRGLRVVFFSDLTRWLYELGTSWPAQDIDWMEAHDVAVELPILGLYLTVSHRAYLHLCDATLRGVTLHKLDGTTETPPPSEREDVRAALVDILARDWPDYVEAAAAMATDVSHG